MSNDKWEKSILGRENNRWDRLWGRDICFLWWVAHFMDSSDFFFFNLIKSKFASKYFLSSSTNYLFYSSPQYTSSNSPSVILNNYHDSSLPTLNILKSIYRSSFWMTFSLSLSLLNCSLFSPIINKCSIYKIFIASSFQQDSTHQPPPPDIYNNS